MKERGQKVQSGPGTSFSKNKSDSLARTSLFADRKVKRERSQNLPHTSSKNGISYQKEILTSPAVRSSILLGALDSVEKGAAVCLAQGPSLERVLSAHGGRDANPSFEPGLGAENTPLKDELKLYKIQFYL